MKTDSGDNKPEKTIQDKKYEAISAALARISAEPVIGEYLGKAKVMLEGGAWWRRCLAYLEKGEAKLNDYSVGLEEFEAHLDGWVRSLKIGCEKTKAMLEAGSAAGRARR